MQNEPEGLISQRREDRPYYGCMTIYMDDSHMMSIAQIEDWLKVWVGGIKFQGKSRDEMYRWIETTLSRFWYSSLKKKEKTVVKKYIMTMTGYSDAQLTRLIKKKKTARVIRAVKGKHHKFVKVYDATDVALLMKTDTAHGRLSGPATKRILSREFKDYGKKDYERIKNISVSHIYNLRGTRQYRSELGHYEKTKPTTTPIGQRRKPEPAGRPGYVRVDTVHQGDCVGENNEITKKGVYHINLVDEVTQWEIMGSVEGISERFLVPILKQSIKQFPFAVMNFHSDNGSEYINRTVAKLLNNMLISQTKSRPRHSNDNGLAETKNGAVIRKHFGYAYIPQPHAEKINLFYKTYMNPYLNFHRPSGYPTRVPDKKKKGKYKNVYKTYLTPFEKLQSLERPEQYLKPNLTMVLLDQFAKQLSDTEAAEAMQKAKRELFKTIQTPVVES